MNKFDPDLVRAAIPLVNSILAAANGHLLVMKCSEDRWEKATRLVGADESGVSVNVCYGPVGSDMEFNRLEQISWADLEKQA